MERIELIVYIDAKIRRGIDMYTAINDIQKLYPTVSTAELAAVYKARLAHRSK